MVHFWEDKHPNDILDYNLDWTAFLENGDYIVDSQWPNFPIGITQAPNPPYFTPSFTNAVTTIWLSGGTANNDYVFSNQIKTFAGRVENAVVILPVRES